MILTIDIGNTNITLGGFENDRLVALARLSTDPHMTADQYAVQISAILKMRGYSAEAIEDAILCSVVPTVAGSVCGAIQMLTQKKPMVLGPGLKTGLNIKIDNPAQLGADLAAGAVGAIGKYPLPCIIIDMGTATTLSVLSKDGAFLGGAIAAGIRSTLDALTAKTAALPPIEIEGPENIIGTNTVDSMKAGLVIGAAAMLDGMIDRVEENLHEKTSVVATGGLAGMVIKHCKREITLDDNLLLEGLLKIYKKNRQK